MEDILEMYLNKMLLFRGTKEEYTDLFLEALCRARDYGIQSNIKFFGRRHHNRILAKKASEDNSFKKMLVCMDDLIADNAEFWKERTAKYNYHYKKVPRR